MRRKLVVGTIALALISASCGSDKNASSSTSTATAPTSAASTTAGSTTAATSADSTAGSTDSSTATTGETESSATGATEPSGDTNGILKTLHSLQYGTSSTFDPAAAKLNCDAIVLRPIYDTLVHADAKTSEPMPGLAESWKVDDPSTIEFTLRKGLTFQDGQKLDATALKAGIEHNVAGTGSVGARLTGLIASVDVVDDLTVKVTTKTPVAATLPLVFAGIEGMIVAPGSDAATKPVGAGPFQYDSSVPQQNIVYSRFGGYYDAENVKLAGVEIDNTGGGPEMVSALSAGDVTLTEISPDAIAGLEGDSNVTIVKDTNARTYIDMRVNLSLPPFNNLAFRQAVSYAIDREAILKAAFVGEGTVASGPFPDSFAGEDPSNKGFYAHDLDKAKQLIKESGLTDLSFTVVNPPYPSYKAVGQIIQQNLAEIGVTVNLSASQTPTDDYYTNKTAQAFIAISTTTADPTDTIANPFTPGHFANPGDYSNDELNALIDQIHTTTDTDKKNDLLRQASVIVVQQALDFPIIYQTNLRAYRNDQVQGEVVPYESCQGVDLTKLWVKS